MSALDYLVHNFIEVVHSPVTGQPADLRTGSRTAHGAASDHTPMARINNPVCKEKLARVPASGAADPAARPAAQSTSPARPAPAGREN